MSNSSKIKFLSFLVFIFQSSLYSAYLPHYLRTELHIGSQPSSPPTVQPRNSNNRVTLSGGENGNLTFGSSHSAPTPPHRDPNDPNQPPQKFNKLAGALKSIKKGTQKAIDWVRNKKKKLKKRAKQARLAQEAAKERERLATENAAREAERKRLEEKITAQKEQARIAREKEEEQSKYQAGQSTPNDSALKKLGTEFLSTVGDIGISVAKKVCIDGGSRLLTTLIFGDTNRSTNFISPNLQGGIINPLNPYQSPFGQYVDPLKRQNYYSSQRDFCMPTPSASFRRNNKNSYVNARRNGKRSFSDRQDDNSSSSISDDTEHPVSKKPAIETTSEPPIVTALSSPSASLSSFSSSSTIAPEGVGLEGLRFTTQESISLELNRIRSDLETLKQNFGDVYQANVAYTVAGSLDKLVKFYQQNSSPEKAQLFTKLSSTFCDLAKKTVPYVKAVGTAISNNSTNFQQQFTQFGDHPVGTTAKIVQQFCNAVITSMDSNGRMILDEKYREKQLRLFVTQIQDFANLPGPQKLEKATEFTLGLFSGCALLGPTGLSGVSAAELSMLSEATQTIYGALKLECINAYQLAAKTGLAPESFAGLTNVIREFPETLVTGLQFGTGEAKKLFNFTLNDQELVTSNYLGKSIAERIKTFAKRFTEKQTGKRSKILETGARRVAPKDDVFAWETWAPEQYDKIRKTTSDVDAIVKNTGMPKHKIERIKNHIFYDDTHKLRNGIGRFDPDPEMASAWNRLVTGDFVENDIKLLEHEYFESKFEKLYNTDYVTADKATRNTKDRGWKDRDWQADDTKY